MSSAGSSTEVLTAVDVGELLRSIAPGDASDRELHIKAVADDHGKIGSVFFSLAGSPPRAYAIYTPELFKLSAYDAEGERKRILKRVEVRGVCIL